MKALLLLLLLTPSLLAAPIILVANKKGQSFEAELLSATDTTATVRNTGNKKLYNLKLEDLSEACVKTIERHRENLTAPYPEYSAEVVIGKRRKKANSSYMVTQTVTATAKITNKDRDLTSPEVACRIVFIGQNQRYPDQFSVLATRDFKISPEPDKTVELVLREFKTTYDSDNEGYGNVGGNQYDGYVLVIYKEDNTVALSHTTNSRFKKALDADIGILDHFRTIRDKTKLGKDLKPLGGNVRRGGDVIGAE